MPDLTAQEIAERLLADRIRHSGPEAQTLTDPIVDTPMSVTLEQLRPYELNPRTARNPRYDELKASIRERGLDAPPPITRRPGAAHYIVRNGGNTRLAILGELWTETKEERFYRINCLFRPWTARGEIVALTGHLAENELHGGLSFIERALGVQKARELYERESGQPLSQRELARRLTTDGYPVSHSHISRMQDAVQHLLPAIPSALYAGLGRQQIVRLLALRSTAEAIWARQALTKPLSTEFSEVFPEVLAPFDGDPETFQVQRVRDELIGRMSQHLEMPHLALAVEFGGADWRDALARGPESERVPDIRALLAQLPSAKAASAPKINPPAIDSSASSRGPAPRPVPEGAASKGPAALPTRILDGPRAAITVEADKSHTMRPDSIATTAKPPHSQEAGMALGSARRVNSPLTVSAASTLDRDAPSSPLDSMCEKPSSLRLSIAQLAQEIADEAGVGNRIEAIATGVGFICIRANSKAPALPPQAHAVLLLLHALSAAYAPAKQVGQRDLTQLADYLAPLLQGPAPLPSPERFARLSDAALSKLFRLIGCARRLLEPDPLRDTEATD